MTTYTYNLRAPTSYSLRLVSNTAVARSTLTGAVQTLSRPGERWEYEVSWENLNGDDREDLFGFFARLNGGEHRVKLPLWGKTQRGTLSGTPLVNGNGQTGATIDINNTGTVTDWIKRGDFLSWGNTFHMATADADSSAGNVTVSIMPKIRTSPSNGAGVTVDIASIYGTFILTSPVDFVTRVGPSSTGGNTFSSLSLTFVEDILA